MKTTSESASTTKDWRKALVEIVLKILTIGFYHISKSREKKDSDKND